MDGSTTFNSRANVFDYDRSDGISAGKWDFFAVVAHEITELMGRIMLTGAGNTAQHGPANGYYPLDLFHYSAPGTRDWSGTTPGYFSIDGGKTDLGDFNTRTDGDWGDGGLCFRRRLPRGCWPRNLDIVSLKDLIAMDVIGYDRHYITIQPNGSAACTPPTFPTITIISACRLSPATTTSSTCGARRAAAAR